METNKSACRTESAKYKRIDTHEIALQRHSADIVQVEVDELGFRVLEKRVQA